MSRYRKFFKLENTRAWCFDGIVHHSYIGHETPHFFRNLYLVVTCRTHTLHLSVTLLRTHMRRCLLYSTLFARALI